MNCKILIIDNTTSLLSPWKKLFHEHFQVIEAVGGHEALTKLRNDYFDALIINISIEQLNGVDALRKIREKYQKVPIIILYKESDALALKQASSYNIQQSLKLPVEAKQLVVTLSKFLPPDKLKEKSNYYKKTETGSSGAAGAGAEVLLEKKVSSLNVEEKFYEGLSAIAVHQFEHAIAIFKSILAVTIIKHEGWLHYINEAYFHLGQCYAHLKDFEASIKHYDHFISKNPNHNCLKEAILYQGKNYQHLHKIEKAGLYYKKVMDMRPMDSFTTQARKMLDGLEKEFSRA